MSLTKAPSPSPAALKSTYEEHGSMKRAGAVFGVSQPTFNRWLLEAGIEIQKQGGNVLPDPNSKAGQIREYLQRHYPCQEVPHGALTEIGAKFGVTRELVRMQARKLNMPRAIHVPAVRLCGCGEVLPKNRQTYCDACNLVPIECVICGKVEQRDRTRYLRNVRYWNTQESVCLTGTRARSECAKELMRRLRATRHWSSVKE